MKRWGIAAAVLLISYGQAAAAPHRIMSLKICTDELLMELVPPERIASVTYLSREKAALRLWPEAAHLPVNHNSAEEVLAAKPVLILTDSYTSAPMRALLAKSGARIVEVPDAENFDQIRIVTRIVGKAVGEEMRAEQLIAQMDARLRQLAKARPARPIRVMSWGGGGFVLGQGTLFNAVLEAAGGTNIAGGDFYDVESLVAARPDVLAYGDDYIDTPSLRSDQDAHPLLLSLFGDRRVIYPAALLGCGTPRSADAALALRGALAAAMRHPGPEKKMGLP